MTSKLQMFSQLVAEINRMAQDAEPNVAEYGLEQLRTMLGFDCAWYGWARLLSDRTTVHASSTIDLPDSFAKFWTTVENQDLVAKALRQNRRKVGLYDRTQPSQTDGMIDLSERYSLKKWACAMHGQPNRTTTFFVSLYRTDIRGRQWDSEDIQLLQCTVDHIFFALQSAFGRKSAEAEGRWANLVVDPAGFTYLGLDRSEHLLRTIWPGWRGERLPKRLQQIVQKSGTYTLSREGLVVCSERDRQTGTQSELIRLKLGLQSKLDRLSPREQQVARLLASGATHKRAASTLGSAPATVRNQTQAIYEKLNINSKAELIDLVLREGSLQRNLATSRRTGFDQ